MKQDLQGAWTLQAAGNSSGVPEAVRGELIPASVPGCVHTDLLAAGLIPDPYLDQNELALSWIGRTDWRYSCCFEADGVLFGYDRLELVCEGLDTVATLELNGQRVASTRNMHRAYRFDVKPFLRAGRNELSVTFAAPTTHSEEKRNEHGDLPNAYPTPFNFIRKMACNYGWDWGPVLTTAGIWRPIYLEAWSTARVASVRPLVYLSDDLMQAQVVVHAALAWAGNGGEARLTAQLSSGQRGSANVSAGQDQVALTLKVQDPELWWPRGHGGQPLYDLHVTLEQADAQLSSVTKRIGLRKTELDTSSDETGSAFTVVVNHKPIFCKGANWIPDDCFPTRVTEARYRERVTQAANANMNMLRVWGGGLYEQDAFYDVCDELGVLVWQDFLFACAAYPEEEPYQSEVEAEARYQVTRLSSHPSLVLWNGNNENIWGYYDWGWQEKLENRTWGKGFYLELLPKVVAELDPTRPYWPGSPYSGAFELHPNADTHGTKHIWDVWNERDYTHYRDYRPRFAAEFGFQAPPTYATVRKALSELVLTPDSPAMLHHQKAGKGQQKLQAGLEAHFSAPETFDDWLYLTQLNQARALQLGVEWFRSLQPRCMGALYWQLNDCWPVTSWAAVDGYGRKKPLWYATRRFYADRLLTIQPRGDKLALFACNDSDEGWLGEVRLQRLEFAGNVLAEETLTLSVPERMTEAVLELPETLATPGDARRELVVARAGNHRATWFFGRDKDLEYPKTDFDASLTQTGTSYQLTLTAKTLLRDVALLIDRLDAEATVSDQLVTLLPGEAFTFELRSNAVLTQDMLLAAPVLQCANRFGLPFGEAEPSAPTPEYVARR